jgi:bacteriocin biosynthesis cyclodehydratase domain-containing protein
MPEEQPIVPIHVISSGAFGRAVVKYLSLLRADFQTTLVDNDSGSSIIEWPRSRVLALVAWRPVPSLSKLLDEVSQREGIPHVPIILESMILRVGPVCIPEARTCCWSCWMARRKQHSAWPTEEAALLEYYDANPDSGPNGYLEPFALMAAARLDNLVGNTDLLASMSGYVWQMNMLTREIITSNVVGIHDCPRCGLRRPARSRSFADLSMSLGYLWTHGSASKQG